MDYTVHRILQARILEWVAFPFSRGFSQPRGQTQVSRIAGGLLISWATGEAHILLYFLIIWISIVYFLMSRKVTNNLKNKNG